MPRRFGQHYSGDVLIVTMRGQRLRCCHCGLVHLFKFRWKRGRLLATIEQDSRATSASRRGRRWKEIGATIKRVRKEQGR